MSVSPASYSSDVEGGAPVTVRYAIEGRMVVEEYLRFVAERAHWFGISGWAAASNGGVTVVAAGPEAMVGALEMACVLGPLTALIGRVEASAETGAVAAGFEIRR